MITETQYLADELELASSKLTHAVVVVDADMARRWLARNINNRPLRRRTVDRYRDDMLAGRWLLSADPVRFNVDGDLIDGQHRLTAIAECDGLSLPLLVVRGLSRETQMVMDQGVKRTPGDQLSLNGTKSGGYVAATVKWMIILEDDLLFTDHANRNPSAIRIQDWVADHEADVKFFLSVLTEVKKCEAAPSIAGAAAILFGRRDEKAAVEFFTLLARGAGTEGHPINTLDRRLRRLRTNRTKLPERDVLAMFIQSWNAWRGGRRVTQLPRPAGGRWTKSNFPEPK